MDQNISKGQMQKVLYNSLGHNNIYVNNYFQQPVNILIVCKCDNYYDNYSLCWLLSQAITLHYHHCIGQCVHCPWMLQWNHSVHHFFGLFLFLTSSRKGYTTVIKISVLSREKSCFTKMGNKEPHWCVQNLSLFVTNYVYYHF